ncbi:MAG: hypothetical protein QM770_06630 [Tepidisphaeraceae bacterium]
MLGLFCGAYFTWPSGVLTAVLAITGFGFGWSSMSYLLSAQNAVGWQQRGIVTSSVSFFRTIGGAVGIGLLGASFNMLGRSNFEKLKAEGVPVAAALDPHQQAMIPESAMAIVRETISSSLLWVFAAMLLISVALFVVTCLMPKRPKPDAEHAKPAPEDAAA